MTYKEHFMKCETMEELLKEAKEEISFAMVLNPDRVKVIKKAVEEVMTEKFSKDGDAE
jgi:epoxyqueuosine reductase QueG